MRVAVIGLGSIGTRHARNLLTLGHEVIGYDPHPAEGPEPWARAADLSQALREAEAAIVASPTSMHAEHALQALEHGRPVLVEKPMATRPVDATRIANLAAERALTCGVAMNLRFHTAVVALRELLQDGRLGAIRLARVSCGSDLRTWRPDSDYRQSYSARRDLGGGVVHDCIHELDYLSWLLGPPVSVTAEVGHVSGLEIDVEDVGLALLRLRSGALASIDLTYLDPVYRRGCLLVGAEATAEWDWTRATIELRRPDVDPEVRAVPCPVAETYVTELEDFVDAIERGREPRTTASEGFAAVELADAVLRAAETGQRVTL